MEVGPDLIAEAIAGVHQYPGKNLIIVDFGTGGFSYLFEDENIFTHLAPDIILEGLYLALVKNS